jgi:hypothetical protein
LADLVLFTFIINGWWFFALPILVIGSWFFRNYFELIIFGIIYDALFCMNNGKSIWDYVGTVSSVSIYFIIYILKKFSRFSM